MWSVELKVLNVNPHSLHNKTGLRICWLYWQQLWAIWYLSLEDRGCKLLEIEVTLSVYNFIHKNAQQHKKTLFEVTSSIVVPQSGISLMHFIFGDVPFTYFDLLNCVLVKISIAMIKHTHRKQLGEERINLSPTSILQSIMGGSQGRNWK